MLARLGVMVRVKVRVRVMVRVRLGITLKGWGRVS